jgi:ABC-type nitrate/sulfonate/bicarbonate transport system permease component
VVRVRRHREDRGRFLFGFFDIFFSVRNGVRNVEAEFIEVARATASGRVMLTRSSPAALPYVATGLRLLHGMVGVVPWFFLENNGIGGLPITRCRTSGSPISSPDC